MKFLLVLIALLALSSAQHCQDCEKVVTLLEIVAGQNKQYVLSELEALCNIVGSQACLDAVKVHGEELYNAILSKATPSKVCTLLTACASTQAQAHVQDKDQVSCFICKTIFEFAEGYISKNNTEQQVEDFLNKVVCPNLGPFASQCLSIVKDYPQLIQFLINQEDPTTACTQVTLCPAPKPKIIETFGDPVGCSICTYIVAILEDYITDNSTEEQLQAIILNDICPTLPDDFQPQCQTFGKELPAYLQQLAEGEPPTKACTDAGVCPAPKPLVNKNSNTSMRFRP